jgi:hypothetical protein
MKYATQLISLLPPVFSPLVTANCWKDDGPKANKENSLKNIYAHAVLMSSKFRDGQTKIPCIDDYSSGNHYYLTMKRGKGDLEAPAEYLHWGLNREMEGCLRGGHTWDGE